MVQMALERWRQAGLSAEDLSRLEALSFEVAGLPEGQLAEVKGTTVKIDETAAGYGWFFDQTPSEDSEFDVPVPDRERQTTEISPAHGKMDLLTVVMRELGTVYPKGENRIPKQLRPLMEDLLSPGVRRMPAFNIPARNSRVIPAASESLVGWAASAALLQPEIDSAPSQAKADPATSLLDLKPAIFNPSADWMPVNCGPSARRISFAPVVRSVAQSKNAPASGETINKALGTIPPGEKVVIIFSVTVNNPPAAAQVSTQGTVSATGISNVLTDDPDTATPNDPTVTLIDTTITWAGGTSTNWDTGSNWSTTFAPVPINDVVIPATGVTNEPTISASSPSVTSLTIAAGRTLTITGQTLNVAGNWTNNGALAGNGTVVFNGNNNTQTLAGSTTFNNLTINHTGTGNVTATGSTLAVGNLMRVQAGTFISSSTFKDVQIDSGATLQQTAATTMNVSGNWTNNGSFTASTGTVIFNGGGAQTIGGSSTTAFNILTDANTAAALAVNTNANAGGALTVNANAILAPAAAVIIGGGGTLTGNGTAQVTRTAATADFSSQYTITNKTLTNLTVEYIGSGAQTCSALTYGNLKINNSSGVTLGGNATVNVLLTLMNGNVDAGANTLSIASGGSINRTIGHVLGNLKKTFSATGAFTYHVGTADGYSPMTATVTAGTGDLTVKAVQQPILNAMKSLQRYWTLNGTGITANLVFQYLAGDVMGDESVYRVIRVTGGTATIFPNSPPTVFVDPAAHTMNFQNASTFSDWTAGEPVSPTAVQLESFEASRYDGGVFIEWRTGQEVNNLGFNLYRDESGKRVLVSPQMLAGSALLAGADITIGAGRSYAWWDSASKDKGAAQYWIESVDINGDSTWHGPVIAKSVGGAPRERSQAALLSQVGSTRVGVTTPFFVTDPQSSARLAQPSLQQSSLGDRAAVKISIRHEGFYRVGASDLFAAGLDRKAAIDLLQLYADGKQVPIKVLTDKQGQLAAIEFYGVKLDTASTDTHTYWLIVGSQPGLRIQQAKALGHPTAQQNFLYGVERKDRTIYFPALRNGDKENFFGAVVAGDPVEQSLTLRHVDTTASGEATVEVALQGVTNLQHRVWVYVNGSYTGELLFTGQEEGVSRLSVPQSLFNEGDNQIRFVGQGGPSDISLIDYARISYWHSFTADDDVLQLAATGGQAVTIGGFTSESVRVFDVTNPDAIQELATDVKKQDATYAVTVTAVESGERRLLAMTDEKAGIPGRVFANQASDLRGARHAADLVIVTSRDFFAALDPLAKLRVKQGFKVELVDIEDIYDEFSNGNRSPQAVKDFLQSAKANWKTGPKFVLLAGDLSYDPKNYLGHGDWDIVPAKLIDTGLLETASDDWFGDFNNDGVPELAVGRLPIRSVTDAAIIVSKIIDYDSATPSAEMLLVADSDDSSFSFEGANDQLRALVTGNLRINEIRRGRIDAATAKAQLIEMISRGQKIINYTGHGSVDQWRGSLLTNDDAATVENTNRYSVFVIMNCLNGYGQDPALDGLGEALIKAQRGGAVAVWASSGITNPDAQAQMNQQLYRLMFNGSTRSLTIGELILRAKTQITEPDVRRTWVLIGDPTMRMR
jgi:predicted small secreted protein